MNNWTEISDAALLENFQTLAGAAGPATTLLAVIKARAYGHGAERCAVTLARAGAAWLGVTCAEEGRRVRQAMAAAGVARQPDVLVMSGSLPEDVSVLAGCGLTPTVWTAEQVRWLGGSGVRAVHVEVDTGMGRQGVAPGAELAELLGALAGAGLAVGGLLTHFSSSEEAGSAATARQQGLFAQAVAEACAAGHRPRWVHAGNSSTVDNPAGPDRWLVKLAESAGARAMVRPGIALYGYCLPIEQGRGPAVSAQVRPRLEPVLRWYARVLAVRTLQPGESVGYNGTWTATRPTRVALLPVGYADGLRRELSSRAEAGRGAEGGAGDAGGGWVMLHGQRAPILGRVSMNLTVVDVTAIPEAAALDLATVLGPGVTADDHARLAGTIAYEILCGIQPCS